MPRPTLWKSIAEQIDAEIAAGHYGPGDRLPSEADLSKRFGVNRHTVRRALSSLSDGGRLRSRRGAGYFVTEQLTDYPIGRRVRFSQNLTQAGRVPARRLLSQTTRAATAREAEVLGLAPGDPVHAVEAIAYADNQPIALIQSVFPAVRLPSLLKSLGREFSVTRALASQGIPDYLRAWTRITAKLATPPQALHLELRPGDPLVRTEAVNTDLAGTPVEYGRTWFVGDRVTLTLSGENI